MVALTEILLQDDVQLVVKSHSSGTKLRDLAGDPTHGSPVMRVHSMMFPFLHRGVFRIFEDHKIRFYVPIRTGYLEERARDVLFDQGDLVEQGMCEFAYVAEIEGLPPVPLIGNSLGGLIAVRLAAKFPHPFSTLILMSPNLARPADGNDREAGGFYKGMQDLKSNALLFKLVNLEYRKFHANTDTCRHIPRTHFSKCDVDLDILEGRQCGHAAYRMFSFIYKSSIVGIAEDFRHVMAGGRASMWLPVLFVRIRRAAVRDCPIKNYIVPVQESGSTAVLKSARCQRASHPPSTGSVMPCT